MKKTLIATMLIFTTFLFIGCNNSNTELSYENFDNPNETYCQLSRIDGVYKCNKTSIAFDTTIDITFYVIKDNNYDIDTVFNDISDIIIRYNKYMDAYNEYDGINNVYTINNSQGPVEIDEELFLAIEYTLDNQEIVQKDDNLLFNIALQPVLDIWHNARYNENCIDAIAYSRCPIPSDKTLSQEFNTNPNDIILNEDNLTIDFNKENMGIDLGGFAKGYVSMIIEEYLNQYEDASYIINLGSSNVLVGGYNYLNKNGEYTIGINEPTYLGFSNYYLVATIKSGFSVVTSGSYQRYIKNLDDYDDETIYHHIIDPRTNNPGGEAMAVTIINNNTGISDILSTALYLMNYEDALAYVNETDNLEAVWYFSEDDIRTSENFSDYFYYYER
ncbi:MAG: FAD:protein FMN transferase [Bacillota bacterium]